MVKQEDPQDYRSTGIVSGWGTVRALKRWEGILRKQDQELRGELNVECSWIPNPAEFKLVISLQAEGPSPGVILEILLLNFSGWSMIMMKP